MSNDKTLASWKADAIRLQAENVKLEQQRDKLLSAAKYACNVIAEERAGGTIESKYRMLKAHLKLFDAVKESDPQHYGLPQVEVTKS